MGFNTAALLDRTQWPLLSRQPEELFAQICSHLLYRGGEIVLEGRRVGQVARTAHADGERLYLIRDGRMRELGWSAAYDLREGKADPVLVASDLRIARRLLEAAESELASPARLPEPRSPESSHLFLFFLNDVMHNIEEQPREVFECLERQLETEGGEEVAAPTAGDALEYVTCDISEPCLVYTHQNWMRLIEPNWLARRCYQSERMQDLLKRDLAEIRRCLREVARALREAESKQVAGVAL